MSDDLAAWLLRCIAEDERVALEATPGTWRTQGERADGGAYIDAQACRAPGWSGPVPWVGRATVATDAAHIARWDPARVLAECAAKRRLIRWVNQWPMRPYPPSSVDGVLELLAQPYAGRDGWRTEWEL